MIVKATLSHIDDLVELFDLYRIFYKKESDLIGAKLFLQDRISNNESVIYIYYSDKLAVGFTQLYPKYSSGRMVRNWILNDLYVRGGHRNQGVGRQLIEASIAFAKERKAEFMQLETQNENVIAQRVYYKMGFELQGPDEEFLLFKKQIK